MGQYNVLIVDDEIHAVKGVLAGVNWQEIDVDNVFTAHSFAQAREKIKNNKIDLLLTDIDMPQGSGIELLGWIRENNYDLEAIFLTCHSDFDYAKEALRLNSLNYLLKPIDYGELTESIMEALEKIDSTKEQNKVIASFDQLQFMQQIHLREQFWLALLTETVESNEHEIQSLYAKFNMNYDLRPAVLPILVQVEDMAETEGHHSTYQLKSSLIEIVGNYNQEMTVVYIHANQIVLILRDNLTENMGEIFNRCNQLIEQVKNTFHYHLSCYIGTFSQIKDVKAVVEELKLLSKNNVLRKNKVFQLRERQDDDFYKPIIPTENWIQLIKLSEKDQIQSEIKQMMAEWKDSGEKIRWDTLNYFYHEFLQIIYYSIQQKGLEVEQVFASNLVNNREAILSSIDSVEKWAILLADVLMDQIQHEEANDTVVDKVKKYIKNNLSKHTLSREAIANYVHFNPDYLVRIFKKETGQSISEYIINKRIEHAEKLLETTKLSISDISLECGYSNFSYFSTLFKKVKGVSPNEYRKELKSRNN